MKISDRYTDIEELKPGGMAMVYTAFDTRLKRKVAIKMIKRDAIPAQQLATLLKRFDDEKTILSKLTHTNIISIFDSGIDEEDGMPYFVMPYYQSGSFKDYLTTHRDEMSWKQRIRLLMPILNALSYAHSVELGGQKKGVIHRDIKPGNILLDDQGNFILADFGIVRITTPDDENDTFNPTVPIGTAPYMAPEQFTGYPTKRSDQYSFGVMLYETLTGELPYKGTSPNEILAQAIQGNFLPIHHKVNGVPRSLQTIIEKMIAKEQENRYPGIDSVIKELETCLAKEVDNRLDKRTGTPPPRPPKKNRSFAISVVGMLAVTAALVFAITAYDRNTDDPTFNSGKTADIVSEIPTLTLEPPEISATETNYPSPEIDNSETMIDQPAPEPTMTKSVSAPSETVATKDNAAVILIPEGSFQMGLNEKKASVIQDLCPECTQIENSLPLHDVYLSQYYIYRFEVTNGQYQLCVTDNVCAPPKKTSSNTRSSYYGNVKYANYPVIWVDWGQAQKYCNWVGGRLPTEAEWEKAGRGDQDARIFPWGNDLPNRQLANYVGNIQDTTEIGSYPLGASPYGIYDMAGNVYEWIGDWFDPNYYAVSPSEDPTGPGSSAVYPQARVVRGGSWGWSPGLLSIAFHDYWEPEKSGSGVGFRCVIPVE